MDIAWISLLLALISLGWQLVKHRLDAGRVKVYLNVAVYEPDSSFMVNNSGSFIIAHGTYAEDVIHGRALEFAQLVVENPGKVPVTVHTPSIHFSGRRKGGGSFTPRMISMESDYGAEQPVTDKIVRLEPYARVTFLFDHWSVTKGQVKTSPNRAIYVRGQVNVAGRAGKPARSPFSKRWKIAKGTHTAIVGNPAVTPYSVVWKAFYVRSLSSRVETDLPQNLPSFAVEAVINKSMSQFSSRPPVEALAASINENAKTFLSYSERHCLNFTKSRVRDIYAVLDSMEGHLTGWTVGLHPHQVVERPEL